MPLIEGQNLTWLCGAPVALGLIFSAAGSGEPHFLLTNSLQNENLSIVFTDTIKDFFRQAANC
jgi:hypothetical protein